MAEIQLKHVTKIYEGGSAAVRDFNLEIHEREFVIFVGPSGCGKSTTLRMIAGLEEITEGELYVDGEYMNDVESCDRDMAMVFQNYALYPHMTVFDNIAYSMKLKKVPKGERRQKVLETAKILGIEDLLERKPNELSGGQKQRVAIARMLMQRAPIMIFDDSLSAVDAETDAKIRDALDQNLGGSTVILISHRITTLMKADCILVLSNGQIAQMGTHQELISQPGIYRDIYNIQTAQEDQALLAQEV